MSQQSFLLPSIEILDLGTMDYLEALEYQLELHKNIVKGQAANSIMILEHPSVITIGNRSKWDSLLTKEDLLRSQGIQVVQTDRGGDITGHELGQLVIYPLIRLHEVGFGPKAFVAMLENVIIQWLKGEGVAASVDPQNPGVWVGANKVCAIGVRIRERVTYHGLAINLNNDLRIFQHMVPCGIPQRGVASVSSMTQKSYDLSQVGKVIADQLVSAFNGSSDYKQRNQRLSQTNFS